MSLKEEEEKKSIRSTIWARWFSDRALRKGCLKNQGPPGEPKIRRSNPIAALQKGRFKSLDVDKLVNISVVIICTFLCKQMFSLFKSNKVNLFSMKFGSRQEIIDFVLQFSIFGLKRNVYQFSL